MKRYCQVLCHQCGRVWIAVTQNVVKAGELCVDCKVPGRIRFNPPIGKDVI